jgi:hypothetical protein
MYTYKPKATLDNYLIGKYPGGVTLYLIGKEAHKNRVNQKIKVTITTVGGNDYELGASTKFEAHEFDKVPNNWLELFKRDNPSLLADFQAWYKQSAKKSEPTPDEYYLVKYNMPAWYIAKRSEYNNPTKTDYVSGTFGAPAMFWDSKDGKWLATVGTISQPGNPHKVYKFPQLSSETKQELQKLNPERYKEWEDFYVAKYPNFKRLNQEPVDFTLSLPSLKLMVFISIQPPFSKNYSPYEGGWGLINIDGWEDKDEYLDFWDLANATMYTVPRKELGSSPTTIFQLNSDQYKCARDKNPIVFDKIKAAQETRKQCGCGTCKDCLSRLPLPDPKDDYIVVYNDSGWCIMQRKDFTLSAACLNYNVNHGWQFTRIQTSIANQEKPLKKIQEWRTHTGFAKIVDKFEQYYAQQEQEKLQAAIASKQYAYDMHGKTPDMFYLYTVGHGWELARREAIKGGAFKPQSTDKVMLIKVSDYSIREVDHKYITQWAPVRFEQLLTGEQRNNFQKQNPILYGQWMHHLQHATVAKQQGSDLDIDEVAMAKDWRSRVAQVGGKEAKHWSFEEAGPFPNPKSIAGIDPISKETPVSSLGVFSWDQETSGLRDPSWFKKQFGFTPAEYYKQVIQEPNIAGVIWTKPRRVGQTKFYEEVQKLAEYYGTGIPNPPERKGIFDTVGLQEQLAKVQRDWVYPTNNNSPKYTPNLKQPNHEILFRQTKPIIRREELTNSDIQSTRREFTVTEGHLDNRPVISSRKKSFRVG